MLARKGKRGLNGMNGYTRKTKDRRDMRLRPANLLLIAAVLYTIAWYDSPTYRHGGREEHVSATQ